MAVNMSHMGVQLCPTLCDLMDHTPQSPLSMGFPRQEYWSRLPCPPPGDLPDPGIESVFPASPALQIDSLLLSHRRSPLICHSLLSDGFYQDITIPSPWDIVSGCFACLVNLD